MHLFAFSRHRRSLISETTFDFNTFHCRLFGLWELIVISFHSSRLLQGFSVQLPIATQFNFNRTNSTQAAYLEAFIPPLGSGVQGAL
jgi:hypothetical protein